MTTIEIICYSLLVLQLAASVTTIVYARKYYRLVTNIRKYQDLYVKRYPAPPP